MKINNNPIKRSEFLASLIKKNSYKVIAEVGVAKGNNARGILKRVKLDKFYLIDILTYPSTAEIAKRPEVEQIEGKSVEIAKKIKDKSLDLVFIDADHGYDSVSGDIRAWLPKVRKGGIVSGHDYDMSDIKQAVKEKFGRDFNVQLERLGKAPWHDKYFTRVWWKYV